METANVNICYRPLRIAWAIHSGDKHALRRAVCLNHTFWGGRFNPIVFADHPEIASDLIEVFRADHIVPIGDGPEVKALRESFSHLISPLFPDELFLDRKSKQALAHVLDIQNAMGRRDRAAQDLVLGLQFHQSGLPRKKEGSGALCGMRMIPWPTFF